MGLCVGFPEGNKVGTCEPEATADGKMHAMPTADGTRVLTVVGVWEGLAVVGLAVVGAEVGSPARAVG